MEKDRLTSLADIDVREARFLERLSQKYEETGDAGRVRSYVIFSVVILVMFALSRWIPWWGVALLVVEIVGLALFHQYKRFALFKSRLLAKVWRHLQPSAEPRDSQATRFGRPT